MDKLNKLINVSLNRGLTQSDKKDHDGHKIKVPDEKTFKYIFESAKEGNEMAMVYIAEWEKRCEATNESEMKVMKMINCAANKFFHDKKT